MRPGSANHQTPTLFARFGTGRPGWLNPHPKDPQEGVEGSVKTLSAPDFATAFRRWYEHCEKCFRIADGYVEKNKKYKYPNYNCFLLLKSSGFEGNTFCT
jgi:hypothetical protein